MIMESPVRICLGAALVVNLLLLISTTVSGSALPLETNSTTIKDDRNSRFARINGTWTTRNNKVPDVALNELRPRESASEEHTEKNAKYKDRGRVRFNVLAKSTTESPLRRVTSTSEAVKVVIITPTPEVKKPAEIIDSMRTYKRNKMPILVSSTSPSIDTKIESGEEYDDKEGDDEEGRGSFEKYTFDESSFFTIPSFNNEDYNSKKNKRGSSKKVKHDYSTPSFESYYPKDFYSSKDEPYKSESFFDFDSELTTPKNDFFDKKFQEISSSILNNLAINKNKSQPPNMTSVHKILKENVALEKITNGIPTNKSTVIIKNTKETRRLDNEGAGSANNELSDVHGTSIYYEMSVLSTETYNITHTNDDDCDNDTLPSESASSNPYLEEKPSLKATEPTIVEIPTRPTFPDPIPDAYSTLQPNVIVASATPSIFISVSSIPYSIQNFVSSTERSKPFTSNFNGRSRNYSKRLNLTGTKDSPNSVTFQTDQATINQGFRPISRRFHHTTPKTKPIWMAPRKNITKVSYTRSTYPTTIYSEHFNIKDRISTTFKPKAPTRTVLTTLPSDIDPVLQSDVSGYKKVVHSPSISDNTIPTLWKRGSTKFSTSTATSTEFEAGVSDMEIPPTLTAWALASLRSPPSLASPVVNITGSTQKSVDENELQKVGEVVDSKITTSSTTMPTLGIINNEIIPKNISEIDQHKLSWKPLYVTSSTSSNDLTEDKTTESKSERLTAESNLSLQSSPQPASTTESMNNKHSKTTETVSHAEVQSSWIPAMVEPDQTTTEESTETSEVETIPPVDTTKSIGFESITKLPAGITTPKDEASASAEGKTEIATQRVTGAPKTTNYEITTIRFSYVPTEEVTESTETDPTTIWHPVMPPNTSPVTIKDSPITTYRPKYVTTTNEVEETTTFAMDTTPKIEMSSQIIENATQITTVEADNENKTVHTEIETTTEKLITVQPTTTEMIRESTHFETTTMKEMKTTTHSVTTEVTMTPEEEMTTMTTEAETETNEPLTEIHKIDVSSEENSGSNEIIQPATQEIPRSTPAPTTELVTPSETIVTTTESTTKITTVVTEPVRTTTVTITETNEKIQETTVYTEETTTDATNAISEDLTTYSEMTTESSSRVLADEAGSGAAVAIAVSTIGVIALVLLVGLLLVVRRRGRRGVYAQRCTPVSLDAYSLDSVSVGHRKGNQRLRASKRSYGNPAYDDEVTSHPMQYAALANFALDIDSMSAEFAEIPSVTVRPEEVPPGCEDKNRYSNVLPLPETRVPLRRIGNDPTTEYINANYITGPGNIRNYYIACQAPLPNTVVDFWRMIWEQNSRLIVMLTEYMENGVEKCYEYLPPSEISDNRRTFGDYQIILKKREQRDKYAISSVQLINLATRTWREITHLWYFWPAKGVPDDYDSVIDFLSEMRSYMKISQNAKEYDEEGVEVIYGESRSSFNNLSKLREDNGSSNGVNVYSPARAEEMMRRGQATNGTLGRMKAASEIEVRPCVLVCASGAGRSAALAAADVCARALAAGAADVPRAVRQLRAQRPHSLSNRHHYIFVYKVLAEYGNKLMGGGVDTI